MADPARVAELSGRGFTTAQLLHTLAVFDPKLVATHFNDTKAVVAQKVEELERNDALGRKAEDIIAGTALLAPPMMTPPIDMTPPATPEESNPKKGRKDSGFFHKLTRKREDW